MKKHGLTLIEVMVALSLLSLLMIYAFGGFVEMSSTFTGHVVETTLESQAEALLEQLHIDFLDAGLSTLVPSNPMNATQISFRKNVGFQNGAIVWSSPITYTYIDRGALQREENGRTTLLASGLQSFLISRAGNVLNFSITFQGLDRDQTLITKSLVSKINVRNE